MANDVSTYFTKKEHGWQISKRNMFNSLLASYKVKRTHIGSKSPTSN